MKLKTSLFKKGLIISDLKRFWWVSALYTLALLFILPLKHYVYTLNDSSENIEWLKKSITGDLLFKNGLSQFFLLVVPIIIGVLVFMYIQKSRSASLYHSLPLTRAVLYFNSVISALILFVTPLLCTTLIMFLLNWFSYLSVYYSAILILAWLLRSLLFGILLLAMTIFVGMFTGSSIAQIAFVYILNVLPMFLVEIVRTNLTELLYGFDTYSIFYFYDNLPMLILYRTNSERITITLVIVYIALTIALFIGGLFAFKLRKPETAGDIITFRRIKPIFIYGVVTCATLLGGACFMDMNNSSFAFSIFGYFISSLISYIVAQMITNKSFKILHTYKGYIGFALVLLILALGIKFDVIGYVNKVPAPSEVEETYIGNNINWWTFKDRPNYGYVDQDFGVYKDQQNIENINKLHKFILSNRSTSGNTQYIAYKLKNGKRIIRRYIIDTDLYASVLGPIYESKEYKNGRYPILYQEVDALKYIEINDARSGKGVFVLSDKKQLESFKVAIRKDIENLPYQDLIINSHQRVLFIPIVDTKDRSVIYDLRSSYTNTLDWLKKEGIYDQVVLKPESVDSVTLESFNFNSENGYGKAINSVSEGSESKRIKITDKAIIQEIITLSLNTDLDKISNYNVTFTIEQHSHTFDFQMSFEDKVSPQLQSYVDKIK